MISKDRMHVIVCHADPTGEPYAEPIASAGFWRRADALAALDRLLGGPDRASIAICDVSDDDGALRPIRERVAGTWAAPSDRTIEALDGETVGDLVPSTTRRGM
jgi:hypothetical protein